MSRARRRHYTRHNQDLHYRPHDGNEIRQDAWCSYNNVMYVKYYINYFIIYDKGEHLVHILLFRLYRASSPVHAVLVRRPSDMQDSGAAS